MNLIKMNQTNGFIYIRNNSSYNVDNACRMGRSTNIPEMDAQFATVELKRGYFELVLEVPKNKSIIIERILQNKFCELNIKYDAGTEFYNRRIITLIEPYLINIGIKYKKLSKQEISYLIRCYRIRKIMKKINTTKLINILKS